MNDKQHGNWVIRFLSGQIQEGPYVNGKKHGNWVIHFQDGRCSIREWSDGVKGALKDC